MKIHRPSALPAALALVVALVPGLVAAAEKSFESTPQVKAYRAQLRTVVAGDFDAYKKTMTKESAGKIDEQMKEMKMDTRKGMEMLKTLAPTDVRIKSVKIEGNRATLLATGMSMGEVNKGTISMALEDGKWKIADQSWTNVK